MNNQKGLSVVVLLIVLAIILAGVLGYLKYFKKSGEVAVNPTATPTVTPTVTPTATPTDKTTNWQTYRNEKYGFSFEYPGNIFAYDVIDYTGGQIPDVAYFGYLPPQYEKGWAPLPAEKMGSARILVWTSVLQDLKTWVGTHEPNTQNWSKAQIDGLAALVHYSKATTASEGRPMTFKTYYLKTGSKIIEIMGFSETNQYSDKWIETFDKIVATFKFTK